MPDQNSLTAAEVNRISAAIALSKGQEAAEIAEPASPITPITSFRPFNDRVLLRRTTLASPSAMFLTPTSAQDKAQVCEVIAIGPGAWDQGQRLPMAARVGSKVYIGKYSGSEVKLPELGDDYLIVREDEILGEL